MKGHYDTMKNCPKKKNLSMTLDISIEIIVALLVGILM